MQPEGRWRGRPVLSAAVRTTVFIVPVISAVSVSSIVVRVLPPVGRGAAIGGYWALSFAISTLALVIVNRAARRLLPLAVLLRLSLAFPDEVPSRLRVARRAANTRDLAEMVSMARRAGIDDTPTRSAEEILSLVAAVEAHDRATRGHSERVRIYTDMLADQMRLHPWARDRLRWAALLHDVGKLSVPAKVLNKPAALDVDEWARIELHPDEGARLTSGLRDWLGPWGLAIEQHHERFDGGGYPRSLSGEEISLAGRMVAVCDAFETMTAVRPYRKPLSATKAREELVRCSGSHFDPAVVRSFLHVSVKRLSLLAGPLSWIAQTPILAGIERAASAARSAGGAAIVGGGLALSPIAPVVPAPISAPPPATTQVLARHPALDGAPESAPATDVQIDERPEPASSKPPPPAPAPDREETARIETDLVRLAIVVIPSSPPEFIPKA